MTETNYVKLGSICRVVSGSTPKKSNTEYWGGNIPWITPAEIDNDVHYVWDTERHITELGVKKATLNELPVGTVLLSSRAPIGKVAITKTPMFCNQGFKNLICSDQVLNEYLYRYLRANTARLQNCGRGATFKELSKKDVENIILPLPSVSCQRNIVSKFESIDNVILYLNKLLELLDELVKSRFMEMFGDPVEGCDWNRMRLDDLCSKLGSGATPRGGKAAYKNEGVPLIRSMNVYNGYFSWKELAYIDDNQAKKLNGVTLRKGDVLLNITGASVARSCVLPSELAGGRVNQHVAIIRADQEKILPVFLNAIFVSESYQHFLLNGSKMAGATREAITKQDLKEMTVPIPPLELQKKFVAFSRQVDKLKFDFDFLVSFKIPSICLLCLELDP